jgi:hypothetical protein
MENKKVKLFLSSTSESEKDIGKSVEGGRGNKRE